MHLAFCPRFLLQNLHILLATLLHLRSSQSCSTAGGKSYSDESMISTNVLNHKFRAVPVNYRRLMRFWFCPQWFTVPSRTVDRRLILPVAPVHTSSCSKCYSSSVSSDSISLSHSAGPSPSLDSDGSSDSLCLSSSLCFASSSLPSARTCILS